MRAWWMLLVAVLAATVAGQEGDAPDAPPEQPPGPAVEAPKEPPAFRLPEKDARKVGELLAEYLRGPAGERAESLKKLEKTIERSIDGHSALEDIEALVGMANRAREFNTKLKKGQITEISVGPEVHGFPAIGTVKYWLHVPKDYPGGDRLWPLLFCIPDQKKHPEGKKYIEGWVGSSPAVAQSFLVVVPQAHAKGVAWTTPESLARAMISLRHAAGTYGVDSKDAGPATDYMRVFIDGEDEASVIAARFAEAFAGAVLRGADGRAGANVARAGQLSGVPAFCVVNPKNKTQREFAQAVLAKNPAGVVVEDETLAGNATAIGLWMEKLPVRPSQPRHIEYSVHDSSFQRHHWVNVLEFDGSIEPAASFTATADRIKNDVVIEVEGVSRFELFLSDALVDLSKPVRIVVSEGDKELAFFANKEERDTVTRDLGTLLGELLDSNQPWRAYPVKLHVDVSELRERAAAAAAAAPADGGKPAGDAAKPAGNPAKPQSTEMGK